MVPEEFAFVLQAPLVPLADVPTAAEYVKLVGVQPEAVGISNWRFAPRQLVPTWLHVSPGSQSRISSIWPAWEAGTLAR